MRRFLVVASLILATAAWAGEAELLPTKPPTQITAARALVLLTREAQVAAKKNPDWADAWGEKPDFAQRENLTVPNDDLLRVLTRRLNPDAKIEAYCKWQLLSFEPDFLQADGETIKRVLATLPKFESAPLPQMPDEKKAGGGGGGLTMGLQQAIVTDRRPVPGAGTRGSRPTLSVVTTGTSMSVNGAVSADGRYFIGDIEATQSNLVRLRRVSVSTNRAVGVFRAALLDRLPEANGIRLATRLNDLAARINAGDGGVDPAAQALLADLRTLAPASSPDSPVSPAMRKRLLRQLNQIAEARTPVAESVAPDEWGVDRARAKVDGYWVMFPPGLLDEARKLLQVGDKTIENK